MSLRPLKYFCLIAAGTLYAQTYDSITVLNNSPLTAEHIKRVAADYVHLGVSSTDSIARVLKKDLNDEGFFNGTISVIPRDSAAVQVGLHIEVNAGTESSIADVQMNEAGEKDSSYLAGVFSSFLGTRYTSFAFEKRIREALSRYENTGYPFARITISQIQLNDHSGVEIGLRFEKGRFCTFDDFSISGNNTTTDATIIRQLRIPRGTMYQQKLLESIPSKLLRTRLFAAVSDPEYIIEREQGGVVRFAVVEKNTSSIDGIVGYVPESSNQPGHFTGLINVIFGNLFGTARQAAVRWQRLDRLSSELELKYREPWIADFPFNVDVHYFQRQQDSSFVQRNINGGVDYIATDELSAGFIFGYQRVIPSIDRTGFSVYSTSSTSTGLKITLDSRDNPAFPRSGLYFQNTYSYIRKSILSVPAGAPVPENERMEQQRYTFDVQYYYSLFTSHVVLLGLHGREFRGNGIEISDYSRMGGYSSLRGYRENQFSAPRIAWMNLEYRIFLERRSFAFTFFDAGYLKIPADAARKSAAFELTKKGYGFGIALESGLGLLNVSYALGEGDSISQGNIHFGVINEF